MHGATHGLRSIFLYIFMHFYAWGYAWSAQHFFIHFYAFFMHGATHGLRSIFYTFLCIFYAWGHAWSAQQRACVLQQRGNSAHRAEGMGCDTHVHCGRQAAQHAWRATIVRGGEMTRAWPRRTISKQLGLAEHTQTHGSSAPNTTLTYASAAATACWGVACAHEDCGAQRQRPQQTAACGTSGSRATWGVGSGSWCAPFCACFRRRAEQGHAPAPAAQGPACQRRCRLRRPRGAPPPVCAPVSP